MRRSDIGQRGQGLCVRWLPEPKGLREWRLQQPRSDRQGPGGNHKAQNVPGERFAHGPRAERKGWRRKIHRQLPVGPHAGEHGLRGGLAGRGPLRPLGTPNDTGRCPSDGADLAIGLRWMDSRLQSGQTQPVLCFDFLLAAGRKPGPGGSVERPTKEWVDPAVPDPGRLDGGDGRPRLPHCGHSAGDLRRAHLDGPIPPKSRCGLRSGAGDHSRRSVHGRRSKGTQFLPKDQGSRHGSRRKHGRVYHHSRPPDLCHHRVGIIGQGGLHEKGSGNTAQALPRTL
mmetsp:Transcript_30355/g.71587  ORF Transcript_30355/g.71587 Transcript_30355/m.71587 type:complete len:283 (+) Transcript_30355:263-1111(+)